MSGLTHNEKLASFALGSTFIVLLLGTIIAAAAMPGNKLANLSGSIIQQPRYDFKTNDLVYHGLFDKYTYSSNDSAIADYRAVIESKILSTRDLDGDNASDLAILSSLILGKTDVGEISIPNYIDLYSITSLIALIQYISTSEITTTKLVPSLNAIHVVPSGGSVILQKAIDIFNEVSRTGPMPTFTFELDKLGSFPSNALNTSSQDALNHAKIINATSSSDARHDCVQISSNRTTGNAIIMPDPLVTSGIASGTISFHLKLGNSARNHVEMVLDGGDTRVWLVCENGTLKINEGSYHWNGASYDSVTDKEDTIGYNITDTQWHQIIMNFDTYTHSFSLSIDPSINLTTGVHSQAFVNSSIPLSYLSSSPSMTPCWTMLANVSTHDPAYPMIADIDDISYLGQSPDFIPTLEYDLSFYNIAVLPINFNYDVIKELFQTIDLYANAAIHVIPFVIQDSARALRITMPSSAAKQLFSLVELIIGSNITTIEGKVDVNMTLCWDKRVSLLNESVVTMNYLDLGIVRQFGIELVATTKGGYPSSPSYTAYAPLFETIDDRIQALYITLWVEGCTLGAAVSGILTLAIIRHARTSRRN